jgi:beta-lactamase superfamily II metal-dependent hydrolase
MRRMALALGFCMIAVSTSSAQEHGRSPLMPQPNTLFMRVIDTGPGLATLTIVTGATASDKKVMIYDGGHWDDDDLMIDELKHYLGRKRIIDVFIISHTDSDHLGAADTILKFWNVKKHVRNGWEREDVGTYDKYRAELTSSIDSKGTEEFVMDGEPSLGDEWRLGKARLTFLSGFADLPQGWDVGVSPGHSRFESKALNSVSIVVRLAYGSRSILLTGDAVGRVDDAPAGQVLGTEAFLVDNVAERPLTADILFAPHHGADNASSTPFIAAVDPEWVIFSAGTSHKHPKEKTFERYRAAGVDTANMIRTDRGDVARDSEWEGDWDDGCVDRHGDDGVSILIGLNDGSVTIDQDPVADADMGC